MKRIIMRAALVWAGFVPLAVINGWVRERMYGPRMNALLAHQISTVTAALAFIGFVRVSAGDVVQGLSSRQGLGVGGAWVVGTILFEFALGRGVRKLRWPAVLADYNLATGRVWTLFLVTEFLTPTLLLRLSRDRTRSNGVGHR